MIPDLAVPPVREEVNLAGDPKSHTQAAGRDEAGRRHYTYHEKSTETGREVKRERLVQLGEKIGKLRAEIEKQLRRQMVDEDFALACALVLLDRARLRVGYREFSREDGGRSATTFMRKDVALEDGEGSSSRLRQGREADPPVVGDPALARALVLLKPWPGELHFHWKDSRGKEHCLSADGANAALRERVARTTNAGNFWTFLSNSIVAAELQDVARDHLKARKAQLKHSISQSASFLSNTPTVCKASHVHPEIQDAFGDELFDPTPLFTGPQRAGLTRVETALLRLLKQKAGS